VTSDNAAAVSGASQAVNGVGDPVSAVRSSRQVERQVERQVNRSMYSRTFER
jgi:hypothetical protein